MENVQYESDSSDSLIHKNVSHRNKILQPLTNESPQNSKASNLRGGTLSRQNYTQNNQDAMQPGSVTGTLANQAHE
jgi:hypothetical protein